MEGSNRKASVCFVLLLLLIGCSGQTTNSTAEMVLKRNPEADIIQYGEYVFQNATEFDHYDQQSLEKVKWIGEIQHNRTTQETSVFFCKCITCRYAHLFTRGRN